MSPRGIDPGLHLDLGSDSAGGGIHLLGGAPNPSTHLRYGLCVDSLALHVTLLNHMRRKPRHAVEHLA